MADLLDEYSMVSFLPLDISDEERWVIHFCERKIVTDERQRPLF